MLQVKQEIDIINEAFDIGLRINDKIIVLANLFFLCVRKGRVSLMQRIITFIKTRCNKNADEYISFIINAFDRNYTPIMRAASNCSVACLRLLLIWGADVNAVNINGEDVFAAAKYGYDTRCKEFPDYELFETKKYKETTQFITYWKENGSLLCTSRGTGGTALTASEDTNIQKNKEELINTDKNIDEQIDQIILQCLEDTNEYKLKLLLEELEQKKIQMPINIKNKYAHEIEEEFPTIIM